MKIVRIPFSHPHSLIHGRHGRLTDKSIGVLTEPGEPRIVWVHAVDRGAGRALPSATKATYVKVRALFREVIEATCGCAKGQSDFFRERNPMTILITGATGQLGRLVVEALLEKAVPADQIVAGGRNPAKLAELALLGVQTRSIDYSDPTSLREAFDGVHKVLLISGNIPGSRVSLHLNVIEAAKDAGVELIAYTSIPNADTSTMALAVDHQDTERALNNSGLPVALLRNGWYLENYTDQLAGYLQHGSVFGSAGEGALNGATREDLAQAAAAVLLADDQGGTIHELGGSDSFTLADLAQEVTAATGQSVTYQDLPEEDFSHVLIGAGVPEAFARILADSDRGIARGDLLVESNALETLLGRPATTLREAVQASASVAAVTQPVG